MLRKRKQQIKALHEKKKDRAYEIEAFHSALFPATLYTEICRKFHALPQIFINCCNFSESR